VCGLTSAPCYKTPAEGKTGQAGAIMSDLAYHGASELTNLIRKREISSRELLDHYLARIDELNPKLNAVVTLDTERARKRAAEADEALVRGQSWGPLHGLPITVKDLFETAGIRTTAGALGFSGHIPTIDAVAVSRLQAAGAIVMGKTNTPVFGSDGQSYNKVFGTTNNPWDLSRSPGGSSGGSAAAIAAGLTGLELGSDFGGSIRGPSHCCGVYGIKPTYGIIPMRGHIPPVPGTLAELDILAAGPIARSPDDLELALLALAGPSSERKIAWRLELPRSRRNSLREYRVAAWLDDPVFPVDREVCAVLEAVVDALRRAGVKVDDRARPAIDFRKADITWNRLSLPLLAVGMPAEQFAALAKLADSSADLTDPEAFQARAYTMRHKDWISVNEYRERLRDRWADFFRDYDVLLCPVMSVAAISHDHSEPASQRTLTINGVERPYWSALIPWPTLVGIAYLPSTAAPVGRTVAGLPVGVQIVGPYLEDLTTIDFVRKLADVIGGFRCPPGF
jgi:amidase